VLCRIDCNRLLLHFWLSCCVLRNEKPIDDGDDDDEDVNASAWHCISARWETRTRANGTCESSEHNGRLSNGKRQQRRRQQRTRLRLLANWSSVSMAASYTRAFKILPRYPTQCFRALIMVGCSTDVLTLLLPSSCRITLSSYPVSVLLLSITDDGDKGGGGGATAAAAAALDDDCRRHWTATEDDAADTAATVAFPRCRGGGGCAPAAATRTVRHCCCCTAVSVNSSRCGWSVRALMLRATQHLAATANILLSLPPSSSLSSASCHFVFRRLLD
jgi:hypothetical protein